MLCISHGILLAEPEILSGIHTAYRSDCCTERMCTRCPHHHGPCLARCSLDSPLEYRAQPQVAPRPPCVASAPSDSQFPPTIHSHVKIPAPFSTSPLCRTYADVAKAPLKSRAAAGGRPSPDLNALANAAMRQRCRSDGLTTYLATLCCMLASCRYIRSNPCNHEIKKRSEQSSGFPILYPRSRSKWSYQWRCLTVHKLCEHAPEPGTVAFRYRNILNRPWRIQWV